MDYIIKNQKHRKNQKIENFIIANNNNCLESMEKIAKEKGYRVSKIQNYGDIKIVVKKILENISEEQKILFNFLGGEPTVQVLGKGQGGRNQN